MKTRAVETDNSMPPIDDATVPTVIAKKRLVDAPPAGLGSPTKEEQNAAEIARLSKWATGECGQPILAD